MTRYTTTFHHHGEPYDVGQLEQGLEEVFGGVCEVTPYWSEVETEYGLANELEQDISAADLEQIGVDREDVAATPDYVEVDFRGATIEAVLHPRHAEVEAWNLEEDEDFFGMDPADGVANAEILGYIEDRYPHSESLEERFGVTGQEQ